MKRALLTGATGFVGSHLARCLATRGLGDGPLEVHVLARPQSSFERLRDMRDRLHVHVVSLGDPAALRRAVGAVAPDYVLHLAAAAMHGGAAAAAEDIVRTNLLGTINLIDACDGVDYACFVNTGDAFEYGSARRPWAESRHCSPTTLDGVTKLGATLHAQQRARRDGKPIVTLRLFSVFGPGDDARRLVPRVIAGALAGTPLSLSRRTIARDYLYVDDVVDLYLAATKAGTRLAGEVLNAGSGRRTTLAEIVETVLNLTRSRAEARWNSYPVTPHDRRLGVADMTRTHALLEWRPRTTLTDGLAATIGAASGPR